MQMSEIRRRPLYASDNDRFDSFIGWRGKIDKEALVLAGFFYQGEGDAVRCFCCQVDIRDWTEDMNPLAEHVKRSPGCEYLPQLISNRDLARMKEQLFDITKMRPPIEGAFNWLCNISTGERVDGEVNDVIRAPQQSLEQTAAAAAENEESSRDASRSIDISSERSEESSGDASISIDISSERSLARENGVQQEPSGDGRGGVNGQDSEIRLTVENIPVRGELGQDVVTHGVNGDDDMDFLMQGTAAQSVLQTGNGTEDDVRAAIIDLRRTGKQDFNGEDIMMFIWGD